MMEKNLLLPMFVRKAFLVGRLLLGRPKYTSSAYCSSDSKAIRIRVERLKRFCERNSELGMILLDRLASGIAERLQSTHDEFSIY